MAQSRRIFKDLVNALTDKEWEKRPEDMKGLRVVLYGVWGKNEQKIAMRYLSPKYYKIYGSNNDDKDTDKEEFESEGVKFIDFPFYCTFTEEVIKHCFFKTLFNESKKNNESEKNNENEESLENAMNSQTYKDTYRDCYKKHCDATPGWHGSPERLHTFTNHGIDRFEKELKNFKNYQKNLKSCQNNIYNQIIHSIAVDYSIEGNLKDGINESKNDKWINLVNSFKFNRQCAVCREFKKNFKHRIVRLRKKCGVVWWLSNFIASSKITKK